MLRALLTPVAVGLAMLLAAPTLAEDESDDVADVSSLELRAGGDAKKHYFLIGSAAGKPPAEGYALLLVLPGGDASAEFNPFVRRIFKHALSERWLVAQLVAPAWNEKQFERLVWPTAKDRYPAAQFTTEQFIEAVAADVRKKTRVDPKRIFVLGWSSGGPPCYSAALAPKTSVAGALVAMSIFKPNELPPLKNARGRAFYLLQSPDDRVTPFRFAESAEKALGDAGGKVQLESYPGGHGWQGDVFGMIRAGTEWLDTQAEGK